MASPDRCCRRNTQHEDASAPSICRRSHEHGWEWARSSLDFHNRLWQDPVGTTPNEDPRQTSPRIDYTGRWGTLLYLSLFYDGFGLLILGY
jgi:hypothetical protein